MVGLLECGCLGGDASSALLALAGALGDFAVLAKVPPEADERGRELPAVLLLGSEPFINLLVELQRFILPACPRERLVGNVVGGG